MVLIKTELLGEAAEFADSPARVDEPRASAATTPSNEHFRVIRRTLSYPPRNLKVLM
jgi:hypothetical protein